jgi:hypothetical protein
MEDEKKLSSAEQREKMKQEYLQELKLRKQILDKMKEAKQIKKISDNLERVLNLAQVSKDMDEFIQKLNAQSEIAEAKLNLSLPNFDPENSSQSTSVDILTQIKMEMGIISKNLDSNENSEKQENTKTLLNEEKTSEIKQIEIEKKFSTKTLGDEEH